MEFAAGQEWAKPFVATFVVSIIPVLMLLAIPALSAVLGGGRKGKGAQKAAGLPLSLMMCFAAGSLLTDSLFHLAEEAKERDPHTVALHTLLGIVLFFVIDKGSRLIHTHGSSASSSTGYLSLIADGVHNFTDGLAIAASFAKGHKSGVATTVAIFMHEIPHELGDYALLAKAGFSHGRIIQVQLFTGAAAFAGTAVGAGIERGALSGRGGDWLLPVTCGGFLYLGLCSILGEVLSDSSRNAAKHAAAETAAFVLGIGILTVLEQTF